MKRRRWTPKKQAQFIKELSQTGNVTLAARLVGLGVARAYELRQEDADFSAAWDEAESQAADLLEAEARRRAVEGVEEPVFWQGVEVAKVRKYSDTLLIFLLKGHKPEKFKDRISSEHSGKDGGPIETKSVIVLPSNNREDISSDANSE